MIGVGACLVGGATFWLSARNSGVTCLICGSRRTKWAFTAPADRWSDAIGWDHGARYYFCQDCTGLTQWPQMTDTEYVRFYEVEQRSSATGFDDDDIPDFHLQNKLETSALKWEFFEEIGLTRLVPAGRRVFEIGTAEGTLLSYFQGRGYQVAGIEPLGRYAAFARDHFGLDVVTGYYGAATHHQDPPDLVVIDNVLEHMPHPAETLRTVRNTLGERGVVLVLVPNAETPVVSNANAAHMTLWTRAALESAMTAAGFATFRVLPGRPKRRPHEWVAVGITANGDVPDLSVSLWRTRWVWLRAIHLPPVKDRLRPLYRTLRRR